MRRRRRRKGVHASGRVHRVRQLEELEGGKKQIGLDGAQIVLPARPRRCRLSKTAVLLHRGPAGMPGALELAERILKTDQVWCKALKQADSTKAEKQRVAGILTDCNALPPTQAAVLLLDMKDFYHGINLKDVSTLVLANVPASYSEAKQAFGRALRGCLNSPGVNVSISMLVGTHRDHYTADQVRLRNVVVQRNAVEGELKRLKGLGADIFAKLSTRRLRTTSPST